MTDTEIEAGTQEFYKAIADAFRAEGRLTYYDGAYGGRLKPRRLLYDLLKKKTGVEPIDWYTAGQEQMITKVHNEAHTGELKFDVLQAQDYALWRRLRNMNSLLSYKPPESAVLPKGTSDPGWHFIHLSSSTHVPMYNPKRFKPSDMPKSWEDFLDPRWKGRICHLALGQRIPLFRYFAWMYSLFGPDYLVALAGQTPKEAKIGDLLMDLLEKGEADLQLTVGAPRYIEAKRQGKSIAYFIPQEGVWYMRSYVGINGSTSKPNLARLFVRFLLSREAQEIVVASDFEAARRDIKWLPDGYPPLDKLEAEGKLIGDSSPVWIDAQDRYQAIGMETFQDALSAQVDRRTLNFQRMVDRVPGQLPGDGYYVTPQ